MTRIKQSIKSRMIDKPLKKASVWLLGLGSALSLITLEPHMMALIPPEWYRWAFILILMARLYKKPDAQ